MIVNSTAPGSPKDSPSKDSTSKAEVAKESDSEDEAKRFVYLRGLHYENFITLSVAVLSARRRSGLQKRRRKRQS